MTIEEVAAAKRELEDGINASVVAFEDRTGAAVRSIDRNVVSRQTEDGRVVRTVGAVTVRVEVG